MGIDMQEYMKQMAATHDESGPGPDGPPSQDDRASKDETAKSMSLINAVNQLSAMIPGLSDAIKALADAAARSNDVVQDDEKADQPEVGDPVIADNQNVEEAVGNTDDSEDELHGDEPEQGSSPDEMKGRHKKFVKAYGHHIPEDGQTPEQFTEEQLKDVPYDKWASESAPFLLASNAFPPERVKGWRGIPQ